jgi:hypothetical protein
MLGLSGPDRRPPGPTTPRQKLGVRDPCMPVGEVNSAIPGSLVPPGVVAGASDGAVLTNGLSKDLSKGFTSEDKAFDGPAALAATVGLIKLSFEASSSLETWMLGTNSMIRSAWTFGDDEERHVVER